MIQINYSLKILHSIGHYVHVYNIMHNVYCNCIVVCIDWVLYQF